MADTKTYTLPSLIGGVSEQSPQDRAPNAHQDQKNCYNDPLAGCRARPGGVVVDVAATDFDMEAPFVHNIPRSTTEHYQVMVADGEVRIFNVLTGLECTVTDLTADLTSYLTHTGTAWEAFDMVTVEDTSFLVNRQVEVEMMPDLSDAAPNKGILFFRSATYSTKYEVTLTSAGTDYTASYTTPDNSTASNADFIATNRLAKEMKDALDTLKASVAPALNGFDFKRAGSTVIIERSGTNTNWDLNTADGQGDTQLIAIKEWVTNFTDLPRRAPSGFVVGIRGVKKEQADDYWLRRSGTDVTGSWNERVKPDIEYMLDETTMPRVLRNTALNTFEIDYGNWGDRISGDGSKSSPDPEFIGSRIRSLNFIGGRLSCMTVGGIQMSRRRNAFSFFADSAQARLDTDPIGFEVANGQTTLLSHSVVVNESLYMWGNKAQLRLDSGDSGVLTEETVDAVPSTPFEYDGKVVPRPVGASSVIFGTQTRLGNSVAFKEVMYANGRAQGEIDLNAHCPKFFQGALKEIVTGSVSGMSLMIPVDNSGLYPYQWLNKGSERVISAWNKWTFPSVDQIISAAIIGGDAYVAFQMGTALVFERFAVDPTDAEERDLRLDHKQTYSSGTVNLPFDVAVEDRSKYVALLANGRGDQLDVTWVDANTATVDVSDLDPGYEFYFGALIEARTRLSPLQVQTPSGPYMADGALIEKIKLALAETTYTRVEVYNKREELLHDPDVFDARLSIPHQTIANLAKGTTTCNFSVGQQADECWIDLVNDTPYPSRWVMGQYYYAPQMR